MCFFLNKCKKPIVYYVFNISAKTSVSSANVQLIYHSVLSELLHDKRRKFTFSETAYFWRWWKEQRGTTRATFRSLVAEGRIQFAGGGWVQPDEATTDYLQLLDLYTWGLRKLNDTLGPCGKPKAGWQIDTYGHSREHTSLLAQMGFDGLFIGRVDHKERESMMDEGRMEFMWRGSDVLGKMSDIMTHTMFNLYNAPEGFCFDFLCNDEPVVDDPDSKVFNADKLVNNFISQIERQAKYYDHDTIMVTLGGDFTYQSAANWFMNIDKLINYVSSHPANMSDVNIFYSTPACYLKAIYLYGRRDKAVHTEKGDHLPYGSDLNTYWTGFYTSRPSLKYLARRAHVFLQIVKQLTVISRMGDFYELHLLRHAAALVLHHDAITGTSQQRVSDDFIRIISEAIDACSKKVSQFLSILTPTWGASRRSKNHQQFVMCHQLNMSQCKFSETQESILLVVYNPLSVKTYSHVRLPAIALHYSIRDFNDDEVEYQLVPLPAAIINLPGRSSTAIQELVFEAENVPPLGFTSYHISPIRDQLAESQFLKKSQDVEQDLINFISNEYIKITVDKTTGLLESFQHADGIKISLSQNFYFYSQTQQVLQSGAYSFRPEKEKPTPVTDKVTFHTIRGPLVKEIRQRFNDWITQVVRLHRGEEFVEIEWIVGPVPIGTDLGKEVVTIYQTNISNNDIFYTDSNSRQMIKRSCWNESSITQQKKPVSSCYAPITSRICIEGNSSDAMCVLTDRTMGGVGRDGGIEIMVHRRLLTDDGFGLDESLNEEAYGVGLVVRGKHRLYVGNYHQEVDDQTFFERTAQLARKWMFEPWPFMTSAEKINRRKWQNIRNKRVDIVFFSALRLHGLPRHIHVLTLEPWKGGSVLLRLENTLESYHVKQGKDLPDDVRNAHITVELRKIFLHAVIKSVRETTLAANQWLEDARQMDWSTRYVYAGGDDGILPEDNPDYIDDLKFNKQADNKENEQDMEERYPRRKEAKQRSAKKDDSKPSTKYSYRTKRSSNNTDLIQTNYTNEQTRNTTDSRPLLGFESRTFVPKNISETDLDIIKTEAVTKKYKKSKYRSLKARPLKFFRDLSKESDEDDEDMPVNLKKRSSKRKNTTKKFTSYTLDDLCKEDKDDGITKSIYEMYYKVKPRKGSFKPYIRSSEVTEDRRVKRIDDYSSEEVVNRSRRRKGGKLRSSDTSERRRDHGKIYSHRETKSKTSERRRRGRREYLDYSQEEEVNSPAYEDYNEEETYTRNKRATQNDEQTDQSTEEADQDYIITLKPTQIRTFVIWFEEKKPYTL
ncbi:unnamed protein product [Danaus chrysippus]|uniref:Alpha-mannosidase n=1 Tax=Danaus chrysippus TaxID=151541 RepID=A0A8J2R5B8_9NEOP|nr:unnamed protein product [Danaus chrysippus]